MAGGLGRAFYRRLYIVQELRHLATAKLGFFGTTPIARPAAYTQTYATATRTHAAKTAVAVAVTGATSTTPFGYTTAAQADAIVTNLNALRADSIVQANLINQILDDLQAFGQLA